jgi:hypothetical protein
MGDYFIFIVGAAGIVVGVLLMRYLGAWMLRIDELIKLLWVIKEMLQTKLTPEEIAKAKEAVEKRSK